MLRASVLALAVCMDTLFAAMGCSMNGIVIPRRCVLLISSIGTLMLGISLYMGEWIGSLLPEAVFRYGGGCLLMGMGAVQIVKELLGRMLERHGSMSLHCRGVGLVIRIYLDETTADADGSKLLSLGEAAAFASAMSLDSLVSGMGAGISGGVLPLCLIETFLLGVAAIAAGSRIGCFCTRESPLACIGGILLMVLGGCRLLG